ncbi:hypothetical protein CTAYLR_007041 [Chrysophaeum taylorii]|uniref:SNF2 super family n=1 Tax=Chrysophaeum taylorii TaxID=2483200 RepID=A0AAD7U8Y3_9STRA|nr:hypothetical protein CTAYLR_007041 [Chrysophaeum taylorii]
MALDQCYVESRCRSCAKACWKYQEEDDMVSKRRHLFWIERARSGQATCIRGCGELIAKGVVRIGTPIADSRGCSGVISTWCHVECVMLADTVRKHGKIAPERDMFGWSELSPSEQQTVVAELAKEDREVDRPLDPSDPAFLPQRALPRVAPPPNIAMTLLPYQEEGFGWMRGRERGEGDGILGGILADEMGMGKTLQAVSLLAADAADAVRSDKSKKKKKSSPEGHQTADHDEYAFALPKTTLVVLPSSALYQWHDEIVRYWKAARDEKGRKLPAPKILVYYQNRGRATPQTLDDHDVVLTTYPVLEVEYRNQVSVCRVECEFCGKRMLPRKLKSHFKYQCGPHARRTAKQAKTHRKADRGVDDSADKRRPAKKVTDVSGTTVGETSDTKPAFFHYLDATREEVEAELGSATPKDVRRLQRDRWNAMSDAEKARFEATEKSPARRRRRRSSSAKGGVNTPSQIYWDLMVSADREDEIKSQFDKGRRKQDDRDDEPADDNDDDKKGRRRRRRRRKDDDDDDGEPIDVEVEEPGDLAPSFESEEVEQNPATIPEDDDGDVPLERSSPRNQPREDEKEQNQVTISDDDDDDVPLKRSSPRSRKPVIRFSPALKDVDDREEADRGEEDVAAAEGGDDAPARRPRALRELDDTLVSGNRDQAPSMVTPSRLRRKQRSSDEEPAPEKKPEPKKKAKKAERKAKSPSKRKADDDEDEYEEEEEEEEDDDDEDDDDYDDDEVEVVVAKKKPASKKAKKEKLAAAKIDDDDEVEVVSKNKKSAAKKKSRGGDDVESESDGEREQLIEELVRQAMERAAEARAKPKKKKRKKSGSKKQAEGKKKKKMSENKKKKKLEDDSESSSSEDESSSSSDDEEEEEGGFAPADLVKDVEGVDLRGSILHCGLWRRVILDEAHRIKGFNSSTAKAAFALRAERRWCLTGTPLQNRVKELQSLVRYLQVDPYAYYFCSKKGCKCKMLYWGFGARGAHCEHCGHAPMMHYNVFNRKILKPIEQAGYFGAGARAMRDLRAKVLNVSMLRRTKKERENDLKLPPLDVKMIAMAAETVQAACSHCFHRDCASELIDNATEAGETPECPVCYQALTIKVDRLRGVDDEDDEDDDGLEAVSSGRTKRKRAAAAKKPAAAAAAKKPAAKKAASKPQSQETIDKGLATLGIKKRRVGLGSAKTDDELPALEEEGGDDDDEEEVPSFDDVASAPVAGTDKDAAQRAESAARNTCLICFDRLRDTVLYDCGHTVACAECVEELRQRDYACPMCRAPIRSVRSIDKVGGGSRLGRASILQKVDLAKWHTSTKVEAVHSAVVEARRNDPDAKAIVFSQYRTCLDIVEWRLRLGGLRVVKLMGDMPTLERKAVLERFKTDPSIAVILLSLKAGGEGLNLQEATHVYLLEPWWNPAVEMQAIQRAHRIGQTKSVTAVRFITKDTIEEKMFDLQEKKRLVFEGTINANAQSFSKLTKEDLEFLFSRGGRRG